MQLKNLFFKDAVFFNQDLKSKDDVISFLGKELLKVGYIKNEKSFVSGINEREKQGSTGIGDGIAIPHILKPVVLKTAIVFIKLKKEIDWNSIDGKPIKFIFAILSNGKDGNEHLDAIAGLSQVLVKSENLTKLNNVKTYKELLDVMVVKEKKEQVKKQGKYDVVGITACPTGIAHTYLAAEKLEEYASELGLSCKIETQGRRGNENILTEEEIKGAKIVILAHEKALTGMSRFNNVEVIQTTTKDAIYNGKDLISKFASNPKKVTLKNQSDDGGEVGELTLKQFGKVKDNLLAGVSRMLPFVVAGGIILGFGFLLDFIWISANGLTADENFGTNWAVAGWFSGVGKVGMELMVPILAAYVCYSIVGPQGLMVGAVAGLMANGDSMLYSKGVTEGFGNLWGKLLPEGAQAASSGFIGALVGAYLGAFILFGLSKLMGNFPKSLHGARDIVFVPVLALLGIGATMFVINIPLGYVMWGIQLGLTWLAENNLLILVCAIAGVMMCVDMGGPINKIAYSIGVLAAGSALVTDQNSPAYAGQQMIMTAAMAAGMVPPLGIAFSTVLFKKVWSEKDRDAAKANWLLGMCFISEGAIPFMIKDAKRIMFTGMAGGLSTGLIIGALQIAMPAPHGGVFVSPLASSLLFEDKGVAMGVGIAGYFLSVIIGMIVMGLALSFWKMLDVKKGILVIQ